MIEAALVRARAAGDVRDIDAFASARCLMGMMIAFALTQVVLGGDRIYPLPRRRIVEAISSVFLDGVAAGKEAGRGRQGGEAKAARRKP
jgi:hypothetical protein